MYVLVFFSKNNPQQIICMSAIQKKGIYRCTIICWIHFNREEFSEETTELPPLPLLVKVTPGWPKKKRDKSSDIIETRASNPYMLKRSGISLQCSHCKEWGDNQRSCKVRYYTFILSFLPYMYFYLHFRLTLG